LKNLNVSSPPLHEFNINNDSKFFHRTKIKNKIQILKYSRSVVSGILHPHLNPFIPDKEYSHFSKIFPEIPE
jgi:hypothetical protein